VKQTFKYELHKKDPEGNPAGGATRAEGLVIDWQDGPLKRGAERLEPNGAFVETVLQACLNRLEFFQASKFKCTENAEAIEFIKRALGSLDKRTKRREEQGVEGTHIAPYKIIA
jgi:hypothetical protein